MRATPRTEFEPFYAVNKRDWKHHHDINGREVLRKFDKCRVCGGRVGMLLVSRTPPIKAIGQNISVLKFMFGINRTHRSTAAQTKWFHFSSGGLSGSQGSISAFFFKSKKARRRLRWLLSSSGVISALTLEWVPMLKVYAQNGQVQQGSQVGGTYFAIAKAFHGGWFLEITW